ncbi:hypothetical protein IWQ62_004999 [Dispira parvispora]|uniref:SHSP domain-containing protein n=1 Tax=Dispira parvispora TaxID=1520584 RepID=A0A9W8E1G3_9FUNG|nr:hypothetical protein IWQ62_004999 [Dispira parvispora]
MTGMFHDRFYRVTENKVCNEVTEVSHRKHLSDKHHFIPVKTGSTLVHNTTTTRRWCHNWEDKQEECPSHTCLSHAATKVEDHDLYVRVVMHWDKHCRPDRVKSCHDGNHLVVHSERDQGARYKTIVHRVCTEDQDVLERRIPIPGNVDTSDFEEHYEDGVYWIKYPKLCRVTSS